MTAIQASEEFNAQLVDIVKWYNRHVRPDVQIVTGSRGKNGTAEQYVTREAIDDLTTERDASVLIHSAFTVIQIVLTSDTPFKLDINGYKTVEIDPDATALDVRTAMQPGLPDLKFTVHSFTGRWIVTATEEDSTALKSTTMADQYETVGFAQEFHSTVGVTVKIKALSATAEEPIGAGNLCVGWSMRGGIRVIPECREYAGDATLPTVYEPPDDAPFTPITFGVCTTGMPDDSQSGSATEPTSGAVLEFQFSDGAIASVTSSGWSWASGSLTITFTGGSGCDWTTKTVVSGTPAGTPTGWREQT